VREKEIWGEFLSRPNRFSIWVRVNGKEELAHLPNPGRLLEVLSPGRPILLRPAHSERKTKFTAVGAKLGSFLVSLDSTLPNRAFPHILAEGWIPELLGAEILQVEPRLGEGRADFLLSLGSRRIWMELKSVTLVRDGLALFPDAPTTRGARHMRELQKVVQEGDEALVLFVVQRPDAERFGPNFEVDPRFSQAFCEALRAGVRTQALVCAFDGEELHPQKLLGPESLVLPEACPASF